MSESIAHWDEWNRNGGPHYPHTKVVQFLFRRFPDPNKRAHLDILDLGCGGGVHMIFLAREGFRPHGRDISAVAIDITRSRLHEAGFAPASLAIGPVDAIDVADAQFDAVICIGVLECSGASRLAAALREITRVLKPGGAALLLFASDLDFRCRGDNPLQLHGFTAAQVKEAIDVVRPDLQAVWTDKFITTYEDQKIQQNEHLLTLLK